MHDKRTVLMGFCGLLFVLSGALLAAGRPTGLSIADLILEEEDAMRLDPPAAEPVANFSRLLEIAPSDWDRIFRPDAIYAHLDPAASLSFSPSDVWSADVSLIPEESGLFEVPAVRERPSNWELSLLNEQGRTVAKRRGAGAIPPYLTLSATGGDGWAMIRPGARYSVVVEVEHQSGAKERVAAEPVYVPAYYLKEKDRIVAYLGTDLLWEDGGLSSQGKNVLRSVARLFAGGPDSQIEIDAGAKTADRAQRQSDAVADLLSRALKIPRDAFKVTTRTDGAGSETIQISKWTPSKND